MLDIRSCRSLTKCRVVFALHYFRFVTTTGQVEVMSPVPGSDEVGRTKHPPALTIKFATFSRKPTPAMMAVGGLPAEMVVHMLVSTRMSPQYGEGEQRRRPQPLDTT